jgi:nitrate reductase delta subunit
MEAASIYAQLAKLFEYPGEEYRGRAESLWAELRDGQTEAAESFGEFFTGILVLSTDGVQELFTRTFDLNPMCTLEVGWQLYGEDYQRGEFLVKMREQLRAHEIHESGELPDHLTHALALLAQMEPDEAAEFGGEFLLPALDKMRAGWRESRNAFAALLDATFLQLKSQYPYDPARMPVRKPELPILQ